MSQAFRSLYVHFPFCETKCHYCDFYSIGRERTKAEDPLRFAQALGREAQLAGKEGASLGFSFETLFFGGGTPSMTDPEVMAEALAPLLPFISKGEFEWTMEANPSSVSRTRLEAYRKVGVNRVSFGIQAFQDRLLLLLGRVHDREQARRALEAVFEAGFTNVSTDLICGVPGQTLGDLEEALTELTHFPITHLSCYLLTLPPHHKMAKDLPEEDEQLRHLTFVHEWLEEKGFEHYEISNFAKPGFRARHNLSYWKGESYLGLGPSAHSFLATTPTRWKNVSSLHKYSEILGEGRLPREAFEVLTPEQQELELWMLTLRLADGFPSQWISEKVPHRAPLVERLLNEGLMEPHPQTPGFLRLTSKGFFLSDQIVKSISG